MNGSSVKELKVLRKSLGAVIRLLDDERRTREDNFEFKSVDGTTELAGLQASLTNTAKVLAANGQPHAPKVK